MGTSQWRINDVFYLGGGKRASFPVLWYMVEPVFWASF